MRVFCFKSVSKFVHHQRKLQTPMSSNLFGIIHGVRCPVSVPTEARIPD